MDKQYYKPKEPYHYYNNHIADAIRDTNNKILTDRISDIRIVISYRPDFGMKIDKPHIYPMTATKNYILNECDEVRYAFRFKRYKQQLKLK